MAWLLRFLLDDVVSRLIFKFQIGGLEIWMANLRTSVSFLYLFFSFIRSAHSGAHTKKKNRNNCRGNQQLLCFIFVFLWSHCGWPKNKKQIANCYEVFVDTKKSKENEDIVMRYRTVQEFVFCLSSSHLFWTSDYTFQIMPIEDRLFYRG